MTYGLNVFRPNTSVLDAAVISQRNSGTFPSKALIDSQVAADNAGALSSRAAVYSAFENVATSPGLPTETEIRSWMLTGLGNNNSTFRATYNYQYTNGYTGKTAAQVQAEVTSRRYNNFNTLSPYPLYQQDNQITTPSLSTQDIYGNNKTILFLNISNKSSFNYDYASVVGLTYNYIRNYGSEYKQHAQASYAAIFKPNVEYAYKPYIIYYQRYVAPVYTTGSINQKALWPSNAYTYEIWIFQIKRNTKSTLFGMQGKNNSPSNPRYPKFHIYIDSSGYVVWDTYPWSSHTSTSTVALGVWSLVTCVYDGTTKNIYINGVRVGNFTAPTNNNSIAKISYLNRHISGYASDVFYVTAEAGGAAIQFPPNNQTISFANRSDSYKFNEGDVVELLGEDFDGPQTHYIRVFDSNGVNGYLIPASPVVQYVSHADGLVVLYGYMNYFDQAVTGVYMRKISGPGAASPLPDFGNIADMGGETGVSVSRPFYIGNFQSIYNYTGYIGQIRIFPSHSAYKNVSTLSIPTWDFYGNQSETASSNLLVNKAITITWTGTQYRYFADGIENNSNYFDFSSQNVQSTTPPGTPPNILGIAYFDGLSQVCEVSALSSDGGATLSSANWNFSSGTNFTIEFYMYNSALPSNYLVEEYCLLSYTNGSGGELWGIYYGAHPNFLTIYNNGTVLFNIPIWGYTAQPPTTLNFAKNTLYHIALNCTGSTIKLFANGIQIAINSSFTGFGTYSSGGKLMVGGPARLGYTAARSAAGYYTGYLASLRIVSGKSIYTTNFPQITRTAALPRSSVLGAYAANKLAYLYPDEGSIEYFMFNGISTGGPVKVFSTDDITWNQVYNGIWYAYQGAFDATFTSCIGRNVVVVQTLIDAPTISASYLVGTYSFNSSTGAVHINASSVNTYITILMQ